MTPFTTDGCSGGMSRLWRLATGRPPPWESACVEHDRRYWRGGSRARRKQADLWLAARVTLGGHPFLAAAMYASVRLGGHPLLPFPWRWGYGYRWPRRYSP